MSAGVARVAAESAIAAIVTAKIRQRDKNFARVSDYTGLEAFLRGFGGGEQTGENIVAATDKSARTFARKGQAVAQFVKMRTGQKLAGSVSWARAKPATPGASSWLAALILAHRASHQNHT